MTTKQSTPLVLLAHGSKYREWLAPFEQLADDLCKDVGRDNVLLCYMESATPTLLDTVRRLAAAGVTRCRVLPLFMAQGAHFNTDIPGQLDAIKKQFPGFEITLLPVIGQHPMFLALMRQLTKEAVNG
ncbi:MAG: CbiX/SirB N-terminal domain-containing protein [Verrucomicrobia bacterium]|nr:CbiX/SirB N-terminal domain-containing protein [Verrucomicrobiota bacterium]